MDDRMKRRTIPFVLPAVIGGWAALLAAGAAPPTREPLESFTAQERSHWAFQKITQPRPPQVEQPDRARNPIDAFVLAELKAKGLKLATRADKVTLIRRATFDLIGLPPTP